MAAAGIPRGIAERAVKRKFSQLEVDAHRKSYAQVADAARILNIPFMNIHMPLDEVGRWRIGEWMRKSGREQARTLRFKK